MDAMVFFSIAMMVSCVILAQAVENSAGVPTTSQEGALDVANMLDVFLRASLGREVIIGTSPEIRIRGIETVAECLRAELDGLVMGAAPEAFSSLNDAFAGILEALSGPGMRPSLLAVLPSSSSQDPLLAVPEHRRDTRLAVSSSIELPCTGGLLVTVLLVLEPAALPELVDV